MKKVILALFIFSFAVLSGVAYADCQMHGSSCEKRCDMSSADMCPVISKFLKKADFLLTNQKAIGLTDDQVMAIKALKLKVDKIVVAEDAGMKTFALDLNAKLSEPQVDIEGIGAMIDQGMTGMAAQTKEVVAAYAEMKGSLSAEQVTKAKALWMEKESQCPMMAKGSGDSAQHQH